MKYGSGKSKRREALYDFCVYRGEEAKKLYEMMKSQWDDDGLGLAPPLYQDAEGYHFIMPASKIDIQGVPSPPFPLKKNGVKIGYCKFVSVETAQRIWKGYDAAD